MVNLDLFYHNFHVLLILPNRDQKTPFVPLTPEQPFRYIKISHVTYHIPQT